MCKNMLGRLHEAASSRSLAGQDLVEVAKQNQYNSVILYICILYTENLWLNLPITTCSMLGQLHKAASGRSLAGQDLVESAKQNQYDSDILYI